MLSAFAMALLSTSARSDVIMDWNAKADAIGIEKQVSNAPNARGQAMLHVAMFEAVNAIDKRYAPYKLNLIADGTTSREAAAASAAHDVLLALYPDQKSDLDATLATSLSAIAETDAKAKGIKLGKEAAAGIIALRANDGSNKPESYRPFATPGVYVPTATPIESTSASITPWAMNTGSQFRPGPPPALTSETWTRDLNEIREIGSSTSTKRTAEQTTEARFWFFTGPRTYNPIVRQVALAKKMDVVDCARLFALSSMFQPATDAAQSGGVSRAGSSSAMARQAAPSRSSYCPLLSDQRNPIEADQSEPKRQRHENDHHFHHTPPDATRRARSAFSITSTEEPDIAAAAIRGVTTPLIAIGTARIL